MAVVAGGSLFLSDGPARAEEPDPFASKCVSVINVPVKLREPLLDIGDFSKVRRRAIDRAAEQAVEEVLGMEIASSREVKTALNNEIADSHYKEEMAGESGGLVRPAIVNLDVVEESGARFLALEAKVSVCVPRKPVQQITGAPEAFFDSATGEPKVWYWRDTTGELEFFDNEGFHPRNGEPLKPVTPDVVRDWRAQQAARTAAEEARRAAEQAAEKERAAAEEEKRHAEEQRHQLAGRCDEFAANPLDSQRPSGVAGTDYGALKLNADQAIEACRAALAANPQEGRYAYQLARALQAGGGNLDEAIQYLKEAIRLHHIAAYDNLGYALSQKGQARAARSFFQQGADAGDPSSLYSMAQILEPKGKPTESYPQQIQPALALYRRAAQKGHPDAEQRIGELNQLVDYLQTKQQQDRETQQMILGTFANTFGGIMGRVGR